MLRCAGCGAPVSEWAARCTSCGRSTADAEAEADRATARWKALRPGSAPTPGGSDRTVRPRRPRRPRRRRLVLAATAVAVAGACIGGYLALTPTAGGLPGGRILATTATGAVVLAAPDGSVTAPLPALPDTGLLAAADGRYLATGTGAQYVLRGRTLVATGRDVPFVGPPGSWRAVDFTDGGAGLVATEQSLTPGDVGVEAVTFARHRTVGLGDAESAVGDPGALGAFEVVAPAAPDAAAGATVERRDAGSAPVVLVTAVDALSHLGGARAGPGTSAIATATLSVVPDPAGDRIAVSIVPGGSRPGPAGIVVLTRTGRYLGSATVPGAGTGRPAWSPDGTSLVYDASTPAHAAVAVWTIGHPPVVRTAGSPVAAGFGDCIWAVTGAGFLCADIASAGDGLGASGRGSDGLWLVGRPGGHRLVRVTGPALPLAWLGPAAPGS